MTRRTEIFEPRDEEDARAWLVDRLRDAAPFTIAGAGTRSDQPKGPVLKTTGLRAIRFFEPDDMVIGVEAGMPFSVLHRILTEKGMFLPANPWFPGATVGGMAATNETGPNRMDRGGLRDAVIGMTYLDGWGKKVKSGGRVVKNVTGYDLAKMMLGSRGGLGLIASVNFKLMPAPIQPCGMYGDFPDHRWLERFRRTLDRRVPLDWVQAVYRGNRWLLGMGFSGNGPRRRRIEQELRTLFGGSVSSAPDDAVPQPFDCFSPQNRHGGFLGPFFFPDTSVSLHLHAIFPTRCFVSREELWPALTALPVTLVLHPVGGDLHLLCPEPADTEAVLKTVLPLFEDRPGYLVLEKAPETRIAEHGRIMPLPAEYPLMQRLKRTLDPKGIFRASFFDLAAEPREKKP